MSIGYDLRAKFVVFDRVTGALIARDLRAEDAAHLALTHGGGAYTIDHDRSGRYDAGDEHLWWVTLRCAGVEGDGKRLPRPAHAADRSEAWERLVPHVVVASTEWTRRAVVMGQDVYAHLIEPGEPGDYDA